MEAEKYNVMKIEEVITGNRGAFDDALPADGHTERFAMKLGAASGEKGSKKNGRKIAGWLYTAMSAAALTAVIAGVLFTGQNSPDDELARLAAYYSCRLDAEAKEITGMLGFMDAGHREELTRDINALVNMDVTDIENAAIPEEQKIYYMFERYNASSAALDNIGGHIRVISYAEAGE